MPLKRAALRARRPRSPTGPGWPARPTRWCSSDGRSCWPTTPTCRARSRAVRERYDGPVTAGDRARRRGDGGLHRAGALPSWAAAPVTLLVRSPERAAEAVAAIARHPRGSPVEVALAGGDRVPGEVVVSTIPAAAQDAGARGPVRRRAGGLRGALRPVADAAGGRGGAAGPCWSAGWTCWCTRRRCSSSCSPASAAPLEAMRAAGPAALARRGAAGVSMLAVALAAPWPVRARRARRATAGPAGAAARARGRPRTGRPEGDAVRGAARRRSSRWPSAPGSAGSRAGLAAVAGGVAAAAVGWSWPLLWVLPSGAGRRAPRRTSTCAPACCRRWSCSRPLLPCSCWRRPSRSPPRTGTALLRAVLGLLAARSVFWALWWIHSAGLGFGDVRLAGLLGLELAWFGWGELAVGHLRLVPALRGARAARRGGAPRPALPAHGVPLRAGHARRCPGRAGRGCRTLGPSRGAGSGLNHQRSVVKD